MSAERSASLATLPAEVYGRALAHGELYVRRADGRRRALPIERWRGDSTPADARVLDRALGPVLDVGCGPGRHVLALARRGLLALGVDIAPAAVSHARARGAPVLLGSVFDPIPGARHWRTALLLDGNIGIGGDPAALLARLADLLVPGGAVLCELDPPGARTGREVIALEDVRGVRSTWFAWARVGVDGMPSLARAARMQIDSVWRDDRRWFAALAARR